MPDVPDLGDDQVLVFDLDTGEFVAMALPTGGATQGDLDALTAVVASKQDSSTAATDAELAGAVATINAAIALKQDSSTASTDAELNAHAADTTFVHGIADTTAVALTTDSRFPTSGQKSGLAGTNGTPGSSNKYVTNSDARNSDARTPTSHTHPTSEVAGLDAALTAKQDASTAATDAELAAGLAAKEDFGKVAGKTVPTPGAPQDQQVFHYDHGSGAYVWAADAGGVSQQDVDATVATHSADTTSVHGVADTSLLVVTSDSRLSDQRVPTDGSVTAAKVNAALKPSGSAVAATEALRALGAGATQAAAGDDGRFPTSGQKNALAGTAGTPGTGNEYATKQTTDALSATKADSSTVATDAELAAHEADTTSIHGIANTANLIVEGDSRLTDARTPTDASVTSAKVAASLKPSGSAAAGTEALRALGTSSSTAAAGNDGRLSDSRAPTAHTHPESDVTNLVSDLAAKQATSEKGQASGYASLDSGGKVPTGQIPALSLVTVQTAASQAAQLALTTQAGDVVVRTDESKTYMHNGGTAGTMADFTLLQTPASAVLSVNGQTGAVSLTYTDVGAAATSHTHTASQVTDFDTQVRTSRLDQMAVPTSSLSANSQRVTNLAAPSSANDAARKVYVDDGLALKQDASTAATDAELAAHEADTTSIHGIADTSALATATSVATAVSNHEADTTSVHGIADTTVLATDAEVATAVSDHSADTTSVHGIADTANLILEGDARLSNARTPSDASVTLAKLAAAIKPSGSAAAGDEAVRALGTSSSTAAAGNDSRLSDSRAPNGAAGGVLSGTYPNPGFAVDMATQAELDAVAAGAAKFSSIEKWSYA